MLNEQDAMVRFKLDILGRAMPARSAIVFGDMFVVEGGYAERCLELGCEDVLLIDTLETPNWLETRKRHPRLNFMKGDFANVLFMKSIPLQFDVGVCFDVLLHQAPLVSTIHSVLEKVGERLCIVQPMIREQEHRNTLIYLPSSTERRNLDPLVRPPRASSAAQVTFDPYEVNHSNWIWAMTPSFFASVLKGEGFEITHEAAGAPLPNDNWFWWGCVAEKRAERAASHWSRHLVTPHLFTPNW